MVGGRACAICNSRRRFQPDFRSQGDIRVHPDYGDDRAEELVR